MWIKTIGSLGNWRIDLHKFVGADDPGCFHTHPAKALRLILYGGYVEQIFGHGSRVWLPGDIGIVKPELCHRVASLINNRVSYSLWIRFKVTHEVKLKGYGWKKQTSDEIPNLEE